jgi:alpha-L-glutamate ligase-like protein
MFFKFWENHGVLGINARNLHYLKLNTREAVRLADDKLKTKQFLSVRGVTVPKTLGKILNRKELASFNFSALPQTFVLKPVHGYGGEGILVLEREGDRFRALGKSEFLTLEDLHMHILDILDGKFSLSGFYDEVFFEQRLVLDQSLQFLVPAGGLPDVRIIYYNLVPTMAMLRLPTRSSGGKANVHLGGVGLGIDLATGKTTYGT